MKRINFKESIYKTFVCKYNIKKCKNFKIGVCKFLQLKMIDKYNMYCLLYFLISIYKVYIKYTRNSSI